MEITDFLIKMKDIQELFLDYLEDEEEYSEDGYQNLIHKIDQSKIREDKDEILLFFHLIIQLSNNHRRLPGFFEKIFRILQYLKNDYSKHFSNVEIFNIFKKNKRVILYFIDEKIINIDESIIFQIEKKKNSKKTAELIQYFPEIRSIIEKKKIEDILNELPENFDEKRRKGENDLKICELIRNDSIIDFVTYINQTNLSLLTTIEPSVYETNSLLIKNKPSLIEYSAFYGSIQIFKFLFMNQAELNQSIWKYAIHGSNPEIIHFLEENKIELQDNYYGEFLGEAFKCHHSELDVYVIDNFIPPRFVSNFKNESFKYYNFRYIEPEFIAENILAILIKYEYKMFVRYILKNNDVIVNYKSISILLY